MHPHTKTLTTLGLTEKESRVYLSLLKLGESSVQDISKEAGIKRPTAYVLLDELREKEIVLKVPQSKRTLYIAKPPDELFNQQVEKMKQVQTVLPELNALRKKDERVNTLYFEGTKGVNEAIFYRLSELKDTEITSFWAKNDRIDPDLITFISSWRKRTRKQGITIRAVAPKHPSLEAYRKEDTAYNSVVKILGLEEYSSNISIEATDLFVRIILFNTPQAIIIESPELVKTVREIFEMVWKCKK